MFGPSSDVFENVPAEHGVTDGPRNMGPPPSHLSGSPDGLGAPPGVGGYPGMGAYAEAVGGKVDMLEPTDVSPQAALRTAGIVSLAAAVAFGSGLALGGAWGGVSGVLLSGSAFNIYRAQKWWGSPDPSEKHEAVVSALFGAIGIASGGYSAYKAYQASKG